MAVTQIRKVRAVKLFTLSSTVPKGGATFDRPPAPALHWIKKLQAAED